MKKIARKKCGDRIVKALMDGYGFQQLKFNSFKCQRHSLWVQNPKTEGWVCHKVDASISKSDFVDALLDEAEIPKYKD